MIKLLIWFYHRIILKTVLLIYFVTNQFVTKKIFLKFGLLMKNMNIVMMISRFYVNRYFLKIL